jgi:hypothetical protein
MALDPRASIEPVQRLAPVALPRDPPIGVTQQRPSCALYACERWSAPTSTIPASTSWSASYRAGASTSASSGRVTTCDPSAAAPRGSLSVYHAPPGSASAHGARRPPTDLGLRVRVSAGCRVGLRRIDYERRANPPPARLSQALGLPAVHPGSCSPQGAAKRASAAKGGGHDRWEVDADGRPAHLRRASDRHHQEGATRCRLLTSSKARSYTPGIDHTSYRCSVFRAGARRVATEKLCRRKGVARWSLTQAIARQSRF